MDRSPSLTADSEVRQAHESPPVQRRLWCAAWVTFAVVVTVTTLGYVTAFVVFPLWLWAVAGGAAALALTSWAVQADVIAARRARGRRAVYVVAQVVAAVLVGVWLWLLWEFFANLCFEGGCDDAVWKPLFVVFPIVPFGGLAIIGFLVRRGVHRGA